MTLKNLFFAAFLAAATAFSMLSIASCKKADPCSVNICQNAISCVNGVCQCEEGWTGTNCNKKKVPVSMTFTKIKVVNYPAFNNGIVWDLTNDPDWYLRIESATGSLLASSSIYANCPLTVSPTFPLTVKLDPQLQVWVKLYEDDSPFAPSYAGGKTFYPWEQVENASNIKTTFQVGDDKLLFEITVTYQY